MDTPDITKEDTVGVATIVTALTLAIQSGTPAVQLAAVVGASVIASLVVCAGAYRRGKRAEFAKPVDVESLG